MNNRHIMPKNSTRIYSEMSFMTFSYQVEAMDFILKDIENTVDARFARCHRAIIVNKDYISKIDHENHTIYLNGGETCPMSVRLGRNLS